MRLCFYTFFDTQGELRGLPKGSPGGPGKPREGPGKPRQGHLDAILGHLEAILSTRRLPEAAGGKNSKAHLVLYVFWGRRIVNECFGGNEQLAEEAPGRHREARGKARKSHLAAMLGHLEAI